MYRQRGRFWHQGCLLLSQLLKPIIGSYKRTCKALQNETFSKQNRLFLLEKMTMPSAIEQKCNANVQNYFYCPFMSSKRYITEYDSIQYPFLNIVKNANLINSGTKQYHVRRGEKWFLILYLCVLQINLIGRNHLFWWRTSWGSDISVEKNLGIPELRPLVHKKSTQSDRFPAWPKTWYMCTGKNQYPIRIMTPQMEISKFNHFTVPSKFNYTAMTRIR